MGDEILRFAQDDRAALPAALWPTQAHARLNLTPKGRWLAFARWPT